MDKITIENKVYKKAISLANKTGQEYIKTLLPEHTFIGIESTDHKSDFFILIAKIENEIICYSIPLYNSGGCQPTYYGDINYFIVQKADNMCLRYLGEIRFWLRVYLIRAYSQQLKKKYSGYLQEYIK